MAQYGTFQRNQRNRLHGHLTLPSAFAHAPRKSFLGKDGRERQFRLGAPNPQSHSRADSLESVSKPSQNTFHSPQSCYDLEAQAKKKKKKVNIECKYFFFT